MDIDEVISQMKQNAMPGFDRYSSIAISKGTLSEWITTLERVKNTTLNSDYAKCTRCGSSDTKKGHYFCNTCHYTFDT